jgi:Flp pilus assembly protein TadB
VRKLRWDMEPAKSSSTHPYRDTAVVYAGLAGLVVVVAAATGGSVVKALIAGLVAFAAATAYSWWRVRKRLRRQEKREK